MTISSLGAAHLAAALAALAFGLLVVMMPKGTQLHRAVGISYAAAMVALNVASLGIYRLNGHFGPFHLMALLSLASVGIGVGAAVLRPRRWLAVHSRAMSTSYLGLLSATAAEIATRVPALHVNSPMRGMTIGLASAAGFGIVGAFLLPRLQRRALARLVAE